ncbi:hypothetical protein EU805_17140 [Salipiger sp. IMCC34102]|uniref:hypothetical protein n=1 Tax=Salipiger sp. IMCC34102 TaxID=2510647 RepID=UPI00101C8D85|nr:hypothetical protein [Salipiger sp. IMCC34102]RYH00689.1 hypothetical protein EU805_17140 [Salipiger sp. IMCC34102]
MRPKDGQRHAAELKRLEDRKTELENALARLPRDEADAEEVMELAKEVELLEEQVATAHAAAQSQDNVMTKFTDVQKAAAANREEAERQLDELAKSIQQPGETFERAYSQALDTDMGRSLMLTRDDAQELERGGVTSMELDEARKNLVR